MLMGTIIITITATGTPTPPDLASHAQMRSNDIIR
jgi:hypothetical protein